jgi:hypothetical protein
MSGKPAQRAIEGVWIDPEFLPLKVRQELQDHLAASCLAEDQKTAFIAFTGEMVQVMMGDETDYAKRVEQLRQVARTADTLLRDVSDLSLGAAEVFQAIEGRCVFSTHPPIHLDRRVRDRVRQPGSDLLGEGVAWVGAISQVAEHAAKGIKVTRGSRPQQHFAKGLVKCLAEWIVDTTGSHPPKDRNGWFAGYAECLGRHLNRPMGPRVVSGAVTAIARTSPN